MKTHHGVDLGVLEDRKTSCSPHGPIQQCIHRYSHHPSRMSGNEPSRRGGQDVIHEVEHVVKVSDLIDSSGVVEVLLVHGNLVEHQVEQHVES